MGERNEVGENRYMRDLLQRFPEGKPIASNEEIEEMELNLGLSLGGCFGGNSKENKLIRSTSIASSTKLLRDDVFDDGYLARTISLPVETEEDRRRRKELQSLRRIEVMRKRSEKQRNIRVGKDRVPLEGICEEDKRVEEEFLLPIALKRNIKEESMESQPFGLPKLVFPAQRIDTTKGFRGFLNLSQGSIASRGSSSSGIFEFESRSGQGLSNCTETRSPTSFHSLPEQNEQKPIIAPSSTTTEKSEMSTAVEVENPSKKPKVIDDGKREMGMKMMEEMPCVSTKGDGPNGKRIEGFLYQYKKGEDVRIVCVCHGIFFSPVEFVKHAGGTDVAHPLRHIVVNPSSSSFL